MKNRPKEIVGIAGFIIFISILGLIASFILLIAGEITVIYAMIFCLILIFTSIALLKGWKWARIGMILLLLINVLGNVIDYFFKYFSTQRYQIPTSIIMSLILFIVYTYYLRKPHIKAYFEEKEIGMDDKKQSV